jgi:hypothetical protein
VPSISASESENYFKLVTQHWLTIQTRIKVKGNGKTRLYLTDETPFYIYVCLSFSYEFAATRQDRIQTDSLAQLHQGVQYY